MGKKDIRPAGGKAPTVTKTQFHDSSPRYPDWFQVTLASIGDGVITTDTEGRLTFLNPVAEALTGWTLQDAAGVPLQDVFRIVNEDTRRPVSNPAMRALREGVAVGLANHTLLLTKDGTERQIDDSAAPIRNDDGVVAGVVLVFRDVTERRRAERQVEDALAFADSIIATLREPFLVLDRDLRIRTANAAFFRTFDVTATDTIGQFVYDLGNRQWDIPVLRTLLEEILPQRKSLEAYPVEHSFPRIGRRNMLLNAHRFLPVHGGSELILLAIEDITDRKLAADTVETSEVRYRRLFETAQDGILILDADTGMIIDANPFMTELLDYSHAEFIAKQPWQIGLFKDKSENEAAFRELQAEGYVRYDHLPLQTKSGRQVDAEFVSNVYFVAGRHVAQCNIRDIRDRVLLERTAQEQATELSDLHRRKDEFLAMLSHELRSPLAPITNAVQLLRLQHGSENLIQKEARAIIERQVRQLKHLVDDLLEVARFTTGRVRLHRERFTASGIVEHAVETVRPLIDQRRHQLTVSVPVDPIWLHADAARLEQVLVNLLTNAAKYTDEGGHIWLAVQEEAEQCVFRVRDNGAGISADLLPRMFDPFTQADRMMDRAEGGLGIGLCIVQRMVELHGGTVEAFSTLGQGSEFVVRLPRVAGVDAPAIMPPAVGRPSIPGRAKVLVVDDNIDMADSMAMLVRAAGYDVRTASDGAVALQVALEYLPDAALLDIGLPGMNGYEIAQRIRDLPVLDGILLVALTGYGQEADRDVSRAAGFDHHLVKPVDFQSVQSILETIAAKAA